MVHSGVAAEGCARRSYGESSFVCVCNSTYCDTAPSVDGILPAGQAVVVSSSKDDSRFRSDTLQFGPPSTLNISKRISYLHLFYSNYNPLFIAHVFTLNASATYQSILGFGGAFTDAAGINIAKLSTAAQEVLMR